MTEELRLLLARARQITPTEAELEANRIAMAVANGQYSDARVTVDTMRASRTLAEAGVRQR